MKKEKDWDEKEAVKVPEITSKEIEDLRSELKRFPQKKIGSRLVSPFEQYLASLGVIRLGESVMVRDPGGYLRMSKINAKLELRQYYEDQEHFAAFPEAKEAQLAKLADLRKGLSKRFV